MSAPEFDPALVEKAAEAGGRAYAEGGGVEDVALAAVCAVAPALRAEGAAEWMKVAVMRDGQAIREAEQRGMVEGARQALLEAADEMPFGQSHAAYLLRERVARIEGRASP